MNGETMIEVTIEAGAIKKPQAHPMPQSLPPSLAHSLDAQIPVSINIAILITMASKIVRTIILPERFASFLIFFSTLGSYPYFLRL